tara:strand:+ start:1640 stop:2485 length:846 start_codon:yes stop_codon:yes gene_type:complete
MDKLTPKKNIDHGVVKSFGEEWNYYRQDELPKKEEIKLFNNYFDNFPFNKIDEKSEGFDLGCGSGRWTKYFAPKVKRIHCIDASYQALKVAKYNLSKFKNCVFYNESVDEISIKDNSMDFGYSLGVLHHLPYPLEGMKNCVKKLKKGSPFLVYLYYNLENRPLWYKIIWKITDVIRVITSRLPRKAKYLFSVLIASLIYFPITRVARFFEIIGFNVDSIPLSFYKNYSFYVMLTDAYDRFGTSLEHRYSKEEIIDMMKKSELENILINPNAPYWCAIGYKK